MQARRTQSNPKNRTTTILPLNVARPKRRKDRCVILEQHVSPQQKTILTTDHQALMRMRMATETPPPCLHQQQLVLTPSMRQLVPPLVLLRRARFLPLLLLLRQDWVSWREQMDGVRQIILCREVGGALASLEREGNSVNTRGGEGYAMKILSTEHDHAHAKYNRPCLSLSPPFGSQDGARLINTSHRLANTATPRTKTRSVTPPV